MSTTIGESVTIDINGKTHDAVVSVDYTKFEAATNDDEQIDEFFYLYDFAIKDGDEWEPSNDINLSFVREDIIEQLKAAKRESI
ncbi:MAG: hypothetical protein JKY89_10880 [Immundisolibacteraceae bacterium]|nr:hypothetical protein [Immundisolibacteraceae bacterium]